MHIQTHWKTCGGVCVCVWIETFTDTQRLPPTPTPHRRSCSVLTGAHLPQPEAINTTAASPSPQNPPHSAPYQLSLHTSSSPPLSHSLSLCLPLHVCLLTFVFHSNTTLPNANTLLVRTREISPCSSVVMKCVFLILIQSQKALCREGLWIHYFIGKTEWKRKCTVMTVLSLSHTYALRVWDWEGLKAEYESHSNILVTRLSFVHHLSSKHIWHLVFPSSWTLSQYSTYNYT